MGFGDTFGAGFGGRFGASLGGEGNPIRDAAAGTMVLQYDAEHFRRGAGVDVAGIPNRGTHGAAADVSQAVVSQRLHAAGAGVAATYDGETASSRELNNNAVSPPFASAGDEVTVFLVATADPVSAGLYAGISGDHTTAVSGISVVVFSNKLQVRADTAAGNSQFDRTHAVVGGFNLYRCGIEAARVVAAVNGVESESVFATSGITLDQDSISVGGAPPSTAQMDDSLKHVSVLVNASAAVIAATEAAIQAYYGTPALP